MSQHPPFDVEAFRKPEGAYLSPQIVARRRCATLPQVTIQEGDSLHLPFQVPSFDAAAASQVYEYVGDLPAALAELNRVLVPGGRAVILDTDWDSLVWEARDRNRAERIFLAWEDHLADPRLPRRLGPLLRQAGFEVGEVRPYPVFSLTHDPFAAGLATRIAASVPGHRGIADEEVSAWMAEMESLSREDGYFFSLTGYLFLAVKPSPR